MSPLNKIMKARTALLLDHPFFGSLAIRLAILEDTTCETMWTDGKTLGYNPDFVNQLTPAQLKGTIAHEVMHCACAHHIRRGNRDNSKWNEACDYAVNPLLESVKLELPSGRLLNNAYKDLSAEEIYLQLPHVQPPQGGQGADPGRTGEIRDLPSGTPGVKPTQQEQRQAQEEWKILVAQAAHQAEQMGDLPSFLDRAIQDILEPKLNWREALRRFIDWSAKNDYMWYPPNRRFISQGIYLPSLKSEQLSNLAIAIDTSGSIRRDMLDQFSSELTSILEEYSTSCTVIYCDTQVAHVEEFSSEDLPISLNLKGGGGTDFRPPFEWIDKHGVNPACLVYLTDMECSRFPDEPSYPVLWVNIGREKSKPPFGEVVNI